MDTPLQQAVDEWHAGVNAGDPRRSAAAVGDPVVVLGPQGSGPVSPDQLAG